VPAKQPVAVPLVAPLQVPQERQAFQDQMAMVSEANPLFAVAED
jgi:hypothetical protein